MVSQFRHQIKRNPALEVRSPLGQIQQASQLPVAQRTSLPLSQMASQQMPQTGLLGSEQALRQALSAGGAAVQAGAGMGRQEILGGEQRAINQLQQAQQQAASQLGAGMGLLGRAGQMGQQFLRAGIGTIGQAGLMGQGALERGIGELGAARSQAAGAFGAGRQQLASAQAQAAGAISQGVGQLSEAERRALSQIERGVSPVQQFIQPGVEAQQLQAALSGARGQEAFDRALIESPIQAFLREQGEQAVTRQAAATGGLGGGNVLKELTRFGQGLAGTQLQQQIANLQALSGQGLQAAGQVGQLRGQGAGIIGQLGQAGASLRGQQASIAGQLGAAGAGLSGQQAALLASLGQAGADIRGRQAALATDIGRAQAGLLGQQAGLATDVAQRQAALGQAGALLAGQLGQTGAGVSAQAGRQIGELGAQTGVNIGNLVTRIGQEVAAGRTRAGEQLAEQIRLSGSALSGLAERQGVGLADIIGASGGELANLMLSEGAAAERARQELGTLLANVATGSASGTQPSVAQFIDTSGSLDKIGQAASGIGGLLAAFSDARLKENITKIGVLNNGLGLYRWDWNEKGLELGGGHNVGVIAQEVSKLIPSAVIEDQSGYYKVDYDKVAKWQI